MTQLRAFHLLDLLLTMVDMCVRKSGRRREKDIAVTVRMEDVSK
jgi:hypothetical protein